MTPLLRVRDLDVAFTGSGRAVPALRGISFDVHAGEVLGIVGESGSGKSVASLAITGLLPPTARVRGSVVLNGREVVGAAPPILRAVRADDVGMIFQDPTTSLNPVLPVGRQITEGEVSRGRLTAADARRRAAELLREVDIADPEGRARQHPHQFSGGMRQRAGIAMAMARHPKLIIADEPTTALDVTVQAQVLAVLACRQAETGAAVILITHDLGVVAEVADRVAVMYCGRIVEEGPVEAIFRHPRHPYTIALLNSIPRIDGGSGRLDPIPGQPPLPASAPSGCAFHPRCALGRGRPLCAAQVPVLREVGELPLPARGDRAGVRGLSEGLDGHGDPDAGGAGDRALPTGPSPRLSPRRRGEGEAGPQRAACHFAEEVALRPAQTRLPATAAPPAPATAPPLLEIENLQVHFPIRAGLLRRRIGTVKAVDGVSLVVRPGETVSLVGESGCGKTTTARAAMGLVPSTGGEVRFSGRRITGLSRRALRAVRREMQYVFQDPFASLNPVLTAGDIVAEPLRIHGLFEERGGERLVGDLFEMVGLSRTMTARYPSEFSGGQKQRIGIARALALKPRLLILDEPVAALDVSIQAQIVNLLQDLQRELNLAYLFIAHDLSVVRHISDRVAVMYLGRIVEESTKDALYASPVHPYTQSLLSAVPVPDPAAKAARRRIVLQGEIPNPAAPPSGCTFHPRCVRASATCAVEMPAFERYPGLPTRVACHHAGPLDTLPLPASGERERARGGRGRAEPRPMTPALRRKLALLKRLLRDPGAALSLVFLVLLAAAAFTGRLFGLDPLEQDIAAALEGPSAVHWFGADELGRDIMARVIDGARTSLITAAGAVALAGIVGVPTGLVAGFFGGWRDAVLMRIVDVLLALPAILFAMALIAVLGRSQVAALVAVGLTGIPNFARVTRAQVLSLKKRDFVLAVEAFGASSTYAMLKTVLPNAWSPILVQVVVLSAVAILLEAALAFLGVGIPPPTPSWGEMLRTGKDYLYEAPTYAVLPGIVLTLTILCFDNLGRRLSAVLEDRHEIAQALPLAGVKP